MRGLRSWRRPPPHLGLVLAQHLEAARTARGNYVSLSISISLRQKCKSTNSGRSLPDSGRWRQSGSIAWMLDRSKPIRAEQDLTRQRGLLLSALTQQCFCWTLLSVSSSINHSNHSFPSTARPSSGPVVSNAMTTPCYGGLLAHSSILSRTSGFCKPADPVGSVACPTNGGIGVCIKPVRAARFRKWRDPRNLGNFRCKNLVGTDRGH